MHTSSSPKQTQSSSRAQILGVNPTYTCNEVLNGHGALGDTGGEAGLSIRADPGAGARYDDEKAAKRKQQEEAKEYTL